MSGPVHNEIQKLDNGIESALKNKLGIGGSIKRQLKTKPKNNYLF